jgi:hypothetical protein
MRAAGCKQVERQPETYTGGRNPGEVSQSVMSEPASAWRALRIISSQAPPGGNPLGFLAKALPFLGKSFFKGLVLFEAATLHESTCLLRLLTVGVASSDPNMPKGGRQFPSEQFRSGHGDSKGCLLCHRPLWQDYASGRAISHVSPWSRQSKCTAPLSWPIIFSVMRVPNPRCVGGLTVGPPASIQHKLSRPSAVWDQAIST